MKINIISVSENGNFIFNESDLSYISVNDWHNKVFKCWYVNTFINIKFLYGISGGVGISVDTFTDFVVGEFITFTYDDKDYSEWKTDINRYLIKYKNIHNNDICVILGNGPTIKKYNKIEGAIHFGMSHIYNYVDFDIDYYFLNDCDDFVKNPNIASYSVNKMKFYSHFKKKSNFIEYGEGIYPKYKKQLDESNVPYEIIDCCTSRDSLIKPFKWFTDIENYTIGTSSKNTGLKILQLALYMGFKHIIMAGCDCSNDYSFLVKRWNNAFTETSRLYDNINISVYNPVNLIAKPRFKSTNIFILEKIDNSSFFFNKYLMDSLFNHSDWDNATILDKHNNELILKYHNTTLGIGRYSHGIEDKSIIKVDTQSLKKELYNIKFKKFKNDILNDYKLSLFNNIKLFTNMSKYEQCDDPTKKFLTINKNKVKNNNIIDFTVENDFVLITNNTIETCFSSINFDDKILLISYILKFLKTKYSFTIDQH